MEKPTAQKPPWPLYVLAEIGKIEASTKELLEGCTIIEGFLIDTEKATEIMRASAIESFNARANYCESQAGCCSAWLVETAAETVTSTLKLAPLKFVLGLRYKEAVPSIATDLRKALQARVDARSARFDAQAKSDIAQPSEGKTPVSANEPNSTVPLEICGPDEIALAMEWYQDGVVWKLKNYRNETVAGIRLQSLGVQSFYAEHGTFRPLDEIAFGSPLYPELKSSCTTEKGRILFWSDGAKLSLGSPANELPWPDSDHSTERRWLVKLRVSWHTGEWGITLDVRWTVGTRTIVIEEYTEMALPNWDVELTDSRADSSPEKGDAKLLQRSDGTLYETVDFARAEEYADITSRRRQQLMEAGILRYRGKGQNRRITVESLIDYCPPKEDTK